MFNFCLKRGGKVSFGIEENCKNFKLVRDR